MICFLSDAPAIYGIVADASHQSLTGQGHQWTVAAVPLCNLLTSNKGVM